MVIEGVIMKNVHNAELIRKQYMKVTLPKEEILILSVATWEKTNTLF